MKFLLTTCLLFALLPAVASLRCFACAGDQEACKHPTLTQCDKQEDICVNVVAAFFVGDLRTGSADLKTCGQSKFWLAGNFSIGAAEEISVNIRTEVCKKNLCNSQTLNLTRRSQYPENDRQCPTCLTFNADSCKANDTITCRGNETKCMYLGLTGDAPEDVEVTLAFRGCATPNACKLSEGNTEVAGGLITGNITSVNCTNAPMSQSALEGYVERFQHLLNLPFMGMKLRDEGLRN